MRAMILAAGLGSRMRPLTDNTPKPLLQAGGKCLIEFHLERLAALGVNEVVINTHWLAEQIKARVGDGREWGLQVRYSHESQLLETAGGIRQAEPWLGSALGSNKSTQKATENSPENTTVQGGQQAFLLINSDAYLDADLTPLLANAARVDGQRCLAVLAMTDNPPEHSAGDFVPVFDDANDHGFFSLLDKGPANTAQKGQKQTTTASAVASPADALTYSGVALMHPALFAALPSGQAAPLAPLLRRAMMRGQISGWRLPDFWLDVGTPERLRQLSSRLASR